MKGFFAILTFAGAAMGHSLFTHIHINGVPDSSCVRPAVSADPLLELSSPDMACNAVKGNAKTKCIVKPGDAIAFEWRVDLNIPAADYPLKDGTIPVGVTDDSHKGPCAVYMKKVNDATTAVGAGDGWFKVTDDGLIDGVFCTDRLRLANAPQPGNIPAGIEPGDYLIRPEFLTLNNAGPVGARQPQFYAGCVQVTVEGTTGTITPNTVSIPGYVNIDTPGLIYDIWNSPTGRFSDYPMVGPAPVTDNAAVAPVPSLPGIPQLPTTTSVAKPTASVAKPTASVTKPSSTTDYYNTPPTSTTPVAGKPAVSSTPSPSPSPSSTAAAVPTSKCNCKIVTATTLITITATRSSYAAPTVAPEIDDSEDGHDDDNDDDDNSDDAPESDAAQPTYGHGSYKNVHGSRRRRS